MTTDELLLKGASWVTEDFPSLFLAIFYSDMSLKSIRWYEFPMLTNPDLRVYKKFALLVSGVVILLFLAYVIGSMTALPGYGFLALELILGLCGAFLIFRRPLIGIALMFLLVPLGPFTQIFGERTAQLGIGVLLLGIYSLRVLTLHEKIKIDRILQLTFAFMLWGMTTSIWAYDPVMSLSWSFRIFQMLAMCILILNYCRREQQLDILTLSFVAGAIFTTIVAFLLGSKLGGTRLTPSYSGYYYDPNGFASTIGIGMILAFYHLYKTKYRLIKAILVLGIAVIMYAIIQAQSRGAWIAISGSLLMSFVLSIRDPKLIKRILVIIVVLIAIVISAYWLGIIDKAVVNRFETLHSGNLTTITSSRNILFNIGLEMIKDSFPIGVGFKNFELLTKHYGFPKAEVSHDAFMAVLAETGLIGFILFVGIFIYLFKNIFRIRDKVTRFICMWVLLCLVLVSLTLTNHYSPVFWFVIILVSLRAKLETQPVREITL